MGCPMYEAYGLTESAGAAFITMIWDSSITGVGGPTSFTEFKLIDIPAMNYRTTDTDYTGSPLPRGEILIRGPGVFKGYYKDLDRTKEVLDEDGWLHTGDVGILLPNGGLRVIDRK